MSPGAEKIILDALGAAGLNRLVGAFYRRVATDDLLGPMYRASLAETGEDLAAAESRLLGFMLFRMGADDRYVRERGHPRLRARHARFTIDASGAERWVRLMDEAMTEVNVVEPARSELASFFRDTAAWMVNSGGAPDRQG